MKKLLSSCVVAGGLLLLSASLWAHHGQAGYDTNKITTVTGTVTDFQFVNPHTVVSIEVKGDKGETQAWQGELTSPNRLVRAGWTSTTLKPGDKVTMGGSQAKSGAYSMWIIKISVNGEELKIGAGD